MGVRCIANSQSHNPSIDAYRVGDGVYISVAFGGVVVGGVSVVLLPLGLAMVRCCVWGSWGSGCRGFVGVVDRVTPSAVQPLGGCLLLVGSPLWGCAFVSRSPYLLYI